MKKNSLTKKLNSIHVSLHQQGEILVFGDVGLDKYTIGSVDRISPEAPVPILKVLNRSQKLGMSANVINNLFDLGVSAHIVSAIGDDLEASLFCQLLEEKKIKTNYLLKIPHWKTIIKERITTKEQQICRVDEEFPLALTSQQLSVFKKTLEKLMKKTSAVIIQDYNKGLCHPTLVGELIKMAKKNNIIVGIDPSGDADPFKYSGCSFLKPNLKEAKALYTKITKGPIPDGPLQLAQALSRHLNIPEIFITMGEDGLSIFTAHNNSLRSYKSVAKDIFDVSGAGDTMMACITVGKIIGLTEEELALFGNIASGVVVGKKGTATTTLAEVITSIRQYQ